MTCQKNERDVHHTIWHFFSWEFVQTCPWVPDYFGSVCFCGKGENLSEQLSELTTNLTHKWRRQVAQVAGKFHTRRKTIFTRMHTLYELDFLAIWHCMNDRKAWSKIAAPYSEVVFYLNLSRPGFFKRLIALSTTHRFMWWIALSTFQITGHLCPGLILLYRSWTYL